MSTAHSHALIETAAFLKQHDPAVAAWPLPRLHDWLAHFWRLAQVGVVTEQGQIRAVGVARCVATVDEACLEPYAHHENHDTGCILWVDQLASAHPLGLPLLLAQARRRFGPRASVSGQVFKRPGDLRLVPWSRVERLLTHHGLT